MTVFKNHKWSILLILLGTILVTLNFILQPFVINGDYLFHLNRLHSLSNIINSPINFTTYGAQGKAVNIFYPPYITSFINIINLFTKNNFISIKFFCVILIFLTFINMYITSYKISKNKLVGVISSFLFACSNYNLMNYYVRFAVGEFISYSFLPLLYLGAYYLFFTKSIKWWILPMALGLIAQSHVITFILSILFVILMFIIALITKPQLKRKYKLILYALVTTIMLSLVTFVPIIEQLKANNIYTTNFNYKLINNTTPIIQYIIDLFKLDFFSLSCGITIIVFLIYSLFYLNKVPLKEQILLMFALFIVYLQTPSVIWNILQKTPINVIQFPYRLNAWLILIVSIITPAIICKTNLLKHLKLITWSVVITQIFLSLISIQILNYFHNSNPNKVYIKNNLDLKLKVLTHKHQDYINKKQKHRTNWKQVVEGNIYLNSKIIKVNKKISSDILEFDVKTKTNNEELIIPLTLYKGLKISDNNKHTNALISKYGSVSVNLKDIKLHHIKIWCEWTLLTRICQIIMIITWLFLIIYIIKKNQIKKNTIYLEYYTKINKM